MRKHKTFRSHLKKELKNPEFKNVCDREGPVIRAAVRIAKERQKLNLTQKELAKRLCTSCRTICRIQKCEHNVSAGLIERIVGALKKK